ncbi:type VII secretion target [Plantactinospora sp. BB1]|uniref:type VII secretion target n=1 Tax=Plantactinospora sp. BB1 TaxID=2071627 RepID=UPI001EEE0919|nr:type VII secretion target [Plantactinospora sp. BB1]
MTAGGDGIQANAADLRAHAGHLDAVAGDLATAKQAGDATRPGPEAYGRLCVIVPALLGQLQSILVEGIDAAAESVRDTGARVRSAADDYQSTDERSSAKLDQIRGGR